MFPSYLFITSGILSALLIAPCFSAKCNCDCNHQGYQPLCGRDRTGEATTYPNRCHLNCYSCTHEINLAIIRIGECLPSDSIPQHVITSSNRRRVARPTTTRRPITTTTVRVFTTTLRPAPNRGSNFNRSASYPSNRSPQNRQNNRSFSATNCNCRCPTGGNEICAKERNSNVKELFPNECMLLCYACTHNKNYDVVDRKECK